VDFFDNTAAIGASAICGVAACRMNRFVGVAVHLVTALWQIILLILLTIQLSHVVRRP